MEDKAIKEKVLNRLIGSVPKGIWVICASYCAVVLTTAISLNFAHIRLDDYLNGSLQLKLRAQEAQLESFKRKSIEIKSLESEISTLKQDIEKLKSLSHEPG